MPKRALLLATLLVLFPGATFPAAAAEATKPPFTTTLTAAQRAELGLSNATPEQLAALDAAVAAYSASAQAVAARDAVAEYREKQEPKVVAAALDATKPPGTNADGEKPPERFTATIVGRFEGWTGGTTFTLDNGQVWRQVNQDRYFAKPRDAVSVAIYKSPSGHWRLRVLDDEGAWITVRRLK